MRNCKTGCCRSCIRLLGSDSIMSVRMPLASRAEGVVSGGRLSIVGPATLVVGYDHKKVVGRTSLMRTLGGKIVTNTKASMFYDRPPGASSPLLGYEGLVMDPRSTTRAERTIVGVTRVYVGNYLTIMRNGG